MNQTRQYWINTLTTMARPVLEHLKHQTLLKQVEAMPNHLERTEYYVVEMLGRVLQGLAPWIETPAIDPTEEQLRQEFAMLARDAIASATDPTSNDFGGWGFAQKTDSKQWVVDAAFVCISLLRAPHELVEKLEPTVRKNLTDCLKLTRNAHPPFNNWLLFCAMTEAGLCLLGEADYDILRIDYALRQHEQWYIGDGRYKDGEYFADDYYNSYVIQPFIAQLSVFFSQDAFQHIPISDTAKQTFLNRFVRYARTQELSIGEDGSFAPIGRSITYRCGAFQTLAQAALWEMLPPEVTPAMARCALNKVIHKTLDAPNTFRNDGFLNIGLCGHQPNLAEAYIGTASVYMATLAFLPLGLPETNPFWANPDEKTSAEKIWGGENVIRDHKLE